MTNDQHEIDFMLRRTAGLLLSDLRVPSIVRHDASVGLVDSHGNGATRVPYKTILFSINAIRLWNKFKTDVMPLLLRLAYHIRSNTQQESFQCVDFDKTSQSFAQGNEMVIKKRAPVNVLWRRNIVVMLVGVEYQIHCRLLLEALRPHCKINDSSNVSEICSLLQKIITDLSFLEEALEKSGLMKELNAILNLKELRLAFLNVIAGVESESSDSLDTYRTLSMKAIGNAVEHTREARRAVRWREVYVSFDTGLGDGAELIIRASTDVPHLFEIWCAVEILNSIRQRHGVRIEQLELVTGHRNRLLFRLRGVATISYNVEAPRTHEGVLLPKVLRGSHVEWLIQLCNDRNIILDTKYMKWNQSENRNVMGYMVDFGADAGIVVFSSDLRTEAYANAVDRDENIVIIDVGEGKTFVAMCMNPSAAHMAANRRALDTLMRHLLT